MNAFVDPELIVKTSAGQLRGSVDGDTHRWLGIPYATPPVGSLRFASPQPAERWEGVRDALSFGDAAPQERTSLIPIPSGVGISEDCLSLNIWTPKNLQPGVKKPVMFWIHGGAYFIGASSMPGYDGRSLAENGDVIVVTINYRLGALGWLDFSAFGSEFERNLGLKDILLALRWVQENISGFGGDPHQVTIFGQSAGGGCVTTLMTLPQAKGLFHQAIAESSPATSVYLPERAQLVSKAYLDLLGVSNEDAAEKLRTLPAEQLASVTMKLLDYAARTWPGTVAFAPLVDGDLITEHPIDVFRAGNEHQIPLLLGTTKDEASFFKVMKSPLMPISEQGIQEMFDLVQADNPHLEISESTITSAYPAYPKQKGAMEISRDAGFFMPAVWVAEAHARHAATWMYRFDQAPPLMKLLGLGAGHASEVPYVFGNLPKKVTKKAIQFRLGGLRTAQVVSGRMQSRWLSFVNQGDPQSDTGLLWPQYEEGTRSTLLINATDTICNDPDRDVRLAWGENVVGYR